MGSQVTAGKGIVGQDSAPVTCSVLLDRTIMQSGSDVIHILRKKEI